MKSVYHDLKITPQVIKAADNETLTGAGVDMQGYEGVAFIGYALKGEALTVPLKAQQAAVSDYSDAADLEGTSTGMNTTVGADGSAVLDIYQPRERYVRPVIVFPNASAATPTAIVAIQYGTRVAPVGNTGEFHQSPAEGTA